MTAARMPRPYVAARLLEHGPLTVPEFVLITGWKPKAAHYALEQLRAQGAVRRDKPAHGLARLHLTVSPSRIVPC